MRTSYLLGALASVLFGAGDLSGGLAARRASAVLVTAISGLGALALLAIGMPLVHGSPSARDLAWGAGAGVCGAAGAALLYRALALGPMSLASPVFSLIGLGVPVVAGVAWGDRPSAVAWAGVALAVLAIPLLARTGEGAGRPHPEHVRRTLIVSIGAGSVIGFFLVCVGRIGRHAGLWPLVLARGVAVALLACLLLVRRTPLAAPRRAAAIAVGAGALDSAANVAFWIAAQGAPLSIVSALASLAPATTVVIARTALGERWSGWQRAGLLAALVAGLCLSLG